MRPSALVIDDDPRLLAQMCAAFEAAGFRTLSAESGRIGAALARVTAPDIVVTDILMPDQEGIATIVELKQAPQPPRIIAISGGGQLAREVVLGWARHLGAEAVLPKPFPTESLVALARHLLQGRPANAEADPIDTEEFVEKDLCASC
jgi:DNA-binding response OmpR family regulator